MITAVATPFARLDRVDHAAIMFIPLRWPNTRDFDVTTGLVIWLSNWLSSLSRLVSRLDEPLLLDPIRDCVCRAARSHRLTGIGSDADIGLALLVLLSVVPSLFFSVL